MSSSPLVGFCGSRSLSSSWSPLVARVVGGAFASRRSVAVGCAAGADALVRSAAGPSAVARGGSCFVFSVSSGRWGSGRSAFARRSAACVRSVAASGPSAAFVGFVSSPCPAGVVPASSWRSGSPVSGSWSSLALAAGLGVRVVVFWCAPGRAGRALPAAWGLWWPVGSGPFAGGWGFVPAQASLF